MLVCLTAELLLVWPNGNGLVHESISIRGLVYAQWVLDEPLLERCLVIWLFY